MLALDPMHVRALEAGPDPAASARARALRPLLRRLDQTLLSLVFVNAAVSAALPILLDCLLSPAAAIALSSTAVVLCAEVLPQAVFRR